jgi:hypothetical protein
MTNPVLISPTPERLAVKRVERFGQDHRVLADAEDFGES